MAKSASPVRLQDDLMRRAALAAARQHRSAAQQIEYWAALGQEVAALLDPDTLLDVKAGLARLRVEPVRTAPQDPESVFASLDAQRRSGSLVASVSTASVRYQACANRPGLLERIDSDGSVSAGTFAGGVFRPCEPAAA
jgi:hypothetical protein